MSHVTTDGWCPCCRRPTTFVEKGPTLRDGFVCELCGSIPRHRAVNYVLDRHFPAWSHLAVHEVAPSNDFVARHAKKFTCSALLEGIPLGSYREDGVRCEDLERLTLAGGSIDLMITQDVLEHVFHPDRALREVMRVLRPGGAHVFTVPRNRALPESRRRASLASGVVTHLLQAEYHGSPVGDGRALVTWDYGADAQARFSEWSGTPMLCHAPRDRFFGLDGEWLDVFVARKPRME